MLHGGLPRAYPAYLGGQLHDELHYAGYEPFRLLGERRALAWDGPLALARPASPSPLDLSLKPGPPGPPSPCASPGEPIEVDDEQERRGRERARALGPVGCWPRGPEPLEPYLLKPLGLSYHPLLQSPQHAPMTPPSTPSPPQRRAEPAVCTPSPGPEPRPEHRPTPRHKKKLARKLKFDEDTSSPVSGTVILGPDEASVVTTGDIDPAFNIVEVTEEARAELAKIENRLGPYQCKLCRQLHDDAFQLAQHRCSRIAHVEYRCPECDKRFSCPANLASHRRWHKPRPAQAQAPGPTAAGHPDLACSSCDAKFSRQAGLRKHIAQHHHHNNNNNNNNNHNNNNSIDNVDCDQPDKIAAAAVAAASPMHIA